MASPNLHFNKIGLEDGLSQVTGFTLYEDELGRIWTGTRNGLNCWDGEHMQSFYPVIGDSLSLIEPAVLKIVAHGRYLWLLSKPGVTCMDLMTHSFQRFYLSNPRAICLHSDTFLVATATGLVYFNYDSQEFHTYNSLFQNERLVNTMYSKGSNLWLGTNGGEVYRWETQSAPIRVDLPDLGEIINFTLHNTDLWIATKYKGALQYNTVTNEVNTYSENSIPYALPSNYVRDIEVDHNGNVWLGTFKGLCQVNPDRKAAVFYVHEDEYPASLPHNSIHDLYIDREGMLWLGTYFGGVSYTDIKKKSFTYYDNPRLQPSHPVIGTMVADREDNIWMATEGNGLDYYDREKHQFVNYSMATNNSGPSNSNIRSLWLSGDSLLLVGTLFGGLNLMDVKTRTFDHLNALKQSPHYPMDINCIAPYRGKYLLGTELPGITIYDSRTKSFEPFFTNDRINDTLGTGINALYTDTQGHIWIGSVTNGLFKYHIATETLTHYPFDEYDSTSVGYSFIVDIREDKKLRLWISTAGGGLSRYNQEEDDFTNYTTESHNIPSNFINGWAESRFGNLWISTTKGLTRFDVENNQFYNYGVASGFPLQELNKSSILLTKDGELFVGGIDGLTSFFEEDIVVDRNTHQVFLSELFINNEKATTATHPKNIRFDIAYSDTLMLLPNQKDFTIAYSSSNFNRLPRIKYQYMLEGFHDDWVNSEYLSKAVFMNIPPGKYQFKVLGTDAAYNPISEERKLLIIIKTPWYSTKVAYAIYILLIVGIYGTFHFSYIKRRILTKKLKLEADEKERIKELNQLKLKFFTNISHEFLTPLTLVIGSIENILDMKQIAGLGKSKLQRALRNALRLKKLTQELLDFRKLEQGYMQLKFSEYNINEFISEIYLSFSDYAKKQNIDIVFNHKATNSFLWIDSNQMEKVFFNLLSNAIKHVKSPGGKVEISTIDSAQEVTIKVVDNGKGIQEEDVSKVFDRFFQSTDQSIRQGSGIGLALCESIVKAHYGTIRCDSKPEEGTVFTIVLKKGYEHISEEQLVFENYEHDFTMSADNLNILQQDPEKTVSEYSSELPLMLIVEDNEDLKEMFTHMFKNLYRMELASNGEEGFEKAMKLQPNIILSDIMMPKVSGSEMCQKLKRNISTSHIPIIMLTALDSVEERIKNLEYGADDYITKPFNMRLLKARIDNIFRNREFLSSKVLYNPEEKITKITQSPIDQKFFERAHVVIDEHLTDPDFTMEKFASIMGHSRAVFFNKVKSISGQTPNELVQSVRLNKAAEMILNNEGKNISEIGFDVGFNSARYFTQCFKQHFGVTPSQYGSNPDSN